MVCLLTLTLWIPIFQVDSVIQASIMPGALTRWSNERHAEREVILQSFIFQGWKKHSEPRENSKRLLKITESRSRQFWFPNYTVMLIYTYLHRCPLFSLFSTTSGKRPLLISREIQDPRKCLEWQTGPNVWSVTYRKTRLWSRYRNYTPATNK